MSTGGWSAAYGTIRLEEMTVMQVRTMNVHDCRRWLLLFSCSSAMRTRFSCSLQFALSASEVLVRLEPLSVSLLHV